MAACYRTGQVAEMLDIGGSTLRRLMADAERAGLPCPYGGRGHLRRWYGDPAAWLDWIGRVQAWRASASAEANGGCGGGGPKVAAVARAPAPAPTQQPLGVSGPTSSASSPRGASRTHQSTAERIRRRWGTSSKPSS